MVEMKALQLVVPFLQIPSSLSPPELIVGFVYGRSLSHTAFDSPSGQPVGGGGVGSGRGE